LGKIVNGIELNSIAQPLKKGKFQNFKPSTLSHFFQGNSR
jgi:hypothetical protein